MFSIPYLVEWLSSWTTLPGDVILTGSPAGTARLEPGDRVRISAAGVTALAHEVVAAADAPAPACHPADEVDEIKNHEDDDATATTAAALRRGSPGRECDHRSGSDD
jgi:Fumarylacetoacetate (FAA) hydrolase family